MLPSDHCGHAKHDFHSGQVCHEQKRQPRYRLGSPVRHRVFREGNASLIDCIWQSSRLLFRSPKYLVQLLTMTRSFPYRAVYAQRSTPLWWLLGSLPCMWAGLDGIGTSRFVLRKASFVPLSFLTGDFPKPATASSKFAQSMLQSRTSCAERCHQSIIRNSTCFVRLNKSNRSQSVHPCQNDLRFHH